MSCNNANIVPESTLYVLNNKECEISFRCAYFDCKQIKKVKLRGSHTILDVKRVFVDGIRNDLKSNLNIDLNTDMIDIYHAYDMRQFKETNCIKLTVKAKLEPFRDASRLCDEHMFANGNIIIIPKFNFNVNIHELSILLHT